MSFSPLTVDRIENIEHLEYLLSIPSQAAIAAMKELDGDMMILGVGGKMGPSLAHMAVRASAAAGKRRRVIGVSRFSSQALPAQLAAWGIEAISCDLLDQRQLDALPDVPNLIYMAGMKFGSTGNESLTWAMNSFLPGMVCSRFAKSRIAAFSTGNIYGLVPVTGSGSREQDKPNPTGEYAMSCLGRERIFEYFSGKADVCLSLLRLNYATEVRYGVLVDLAQRVWRGQTIDLAMGHVNVIFQGEANAMALASLCLAAAPPFVLNIAGPEILKVRDVCQEFARLMNKTPNFVGSEASDALLNDGSLGRKLFGDERVPVARMLGWIADWVMHDGANLGKPTHFESRTGKF